MQDDDLSALEATTGLPTLFGGAGLHYFDATTSTNEVAKDLARAGAAEGTVVVADYQFAGRGRMGRSWVAPRRSSLLVSVVLRPSLEELNSLVMAGALAMVRAIESATELKPSIKWPNDVEIGGKKVCGILVETEIERGALRFAVLGAGLNVNFDPRDHPEIAPTATSLSTEVGRPVGRAPLLRSYLQALERYYLDARQGAPIWQEWRARLNTLGQWVRLISGDAVTEGWAEDVDATGKLHLRLADGQVVTALAGEVSLRAGGEDGEKGKGGRGE